MIANSLSITIAQRTREFATLRTLGASRRQVRLSVLMESLAIGTLASVVGLFLGLALAKGLFWLFTAFGCDAARTTVFPFEPRTIIVSLLVGILVTVLASLRPAFRATRVPPIAAVREGAVIPPGRFARFRVVGAILVAALGFALVLFGLFVATRHGRRAPLDAGRRACSSSSACRSSPPSSSVRSQAFSAGRPLASAASPAGWRATTPNGTHSERPRRRRR